MRFLNLKDGWLIVFKPQTINTAADCFGLPEHSRNDIPFGLQNPVHFQQVRQSESGCRRCNLQPLGNLLGKN